MALTKPKRSSRLSVAFEERNTVMPEVSRRSGGIGLTSLATVHKHISTLENNGVLPARLHQTGPSIVQLPNPVKS